MLVAPGVTRVLTSVLYGISPPAPYAIVAACAVLLGAAAMAAALPTRRAATVDPVEALRRE